MTGESDKRRNQRNAKKRRIESTLSENTQASRIYQMNELVSCNCSIAPAPLQYRSLDNGGGVHDTISIIDDTNQPKVHSAGLHHCYPQLNWNRLSGLTPCNKRYARRLFSDTQLPEATRNVANTKTISTTLNTIFVTTLSAQESWRARTVIGRPCTLYNQCDMPSCVT